MREIKFNAWHTLLKKMFSCEEMVDDQMCLLPNGKFVNVNSVSTKLSKIDDDRVMIPLQFTGLKDKNGKEIYEGDILGDDFGIIGEVKYYIGKAGFFIERRATYTSFENWRKTQDDNAYCLFTVIGNIHENPELLKEPKNERG